MKKCKYCQSDIDSKAKICPHCRKKQSHTGIILFTIISIIIIACAGLYIIIDYLMSNSLSSMDETFLKDDAYSFSIDYINNCIELESISYDVKSYWYDSIHEDKYNGDINEAVNQALEDNKVKVQNQKDKYDSMRTSYTKIIDSKCKSDFCIKIKDNVKGAYKAYKKEYILAINPSGSYYDYSKDLKEIHSEVAEYFEELDILLGITNE